jgi:hypothetical protein
MAPGNLDYVICRHGYGGRGKDVVEAPAVGQTGTLCYDDFYEISRSAPDP